MSGIAGILYFNQQPLQPGAVSRLLSAMQSYGPDGNHCYEKDSLALGFCQLKVTPEDAFDSQPRVGPQNRYVLLWDGRLDNRGELASLLAIDPARLKTMPDSELALESYLKWGENCPQKFLGDFAMAVWDNATGKLFFCRDPFGARPIYFVHTEQFFAFASYDEALLLLDGVNPEPNEEAIAYLLISGFTDLDYRRTWLKHISAIPPSTCVTVSADGKVAKHRYWELAPGRELSFTSDEECQEAFREIFSEAVTCRLRSTEDVAMMLSGGMDSASVAATLFNLDKSGSLPLPVHSYSVIEDEHTASIESRSIKSLAERFGNRAHLLNIPSFTGFSNREKIVELSWQRAHPVDGSLLMPNVMCQRAAENGHRVMLHATSGDITMNIPYRYPAVFLRQGRVLRMIKECYYATTNNTYQKGSSLISMLLLNCWSGLLPLKLRTSIQKMRTEQSVPAPERNFFSKSLFDEMQIAERFNKPMHEQFAASAVEDPQEQQIAVINGLHGIVTGLFGMQRIAAMHGMENRDPWADRRVIEFFVNLPLRYKVKNGWTKYMARSAFSGDLPDSVLWRNDKEHLGWMFQQMVVDNSKDELVNWLTSCEKLEKWLDIREIKGFADDFTQYKEYENIADKQILYDLVLVVLWVERILSLSQGQEA